MTKAAGPVWLWLWLCALAASGGAGCGGEGAAPAECVADDDCGANAGGGLCVAKTCLPRVGPDEPIDVEVRPRVETPFAGQQFASVLFPPGGVDLRVDGRSRVSGSVVLPAGAVAGPSQAQAQVVFSFPSSISGLPNPRYETPASGMGGALVFQADLPRSLFGRTDGTTQVVPLGALAETTPPWTSPALLMETLPPITPPAEAGLLRVNGRLRERVEGEPLPGYVARALVAGVVVSNRGIVDRTTGAFSLSIPKALTPSGTLEGVIVELVASNNAVPLPRLEATAVSATLPPIALPPFRNPTTFEMSVESRNASGDTVAVAGVSLYFRTRLPETENAQAYYEQQAQTDAAGKVRVMLIPGMGNINQEYWISVAPLPSSPYASACVKRAIPARATNEAAVLSAIQLEPGVVMRGVVRAANGAPQADVAVRAQRQDEEWRRPCGSDLKARDTSATTTADGVYTLQIEPGAYRVTYTPGDGAASPPALDPRIDVAAPLAHDKQLPEGAVAAGRVVSPEGAPVRDSDVSGYLPGGAAPAATARSDMAGRFRLVVPRR